MRRRLLLAAAVIAALALPVASPAAPAGSTVTPGGVFVTGHDPDFHAILPSPNAAGARNITQRAVEYVTHGNPSPSMLLVTSRITPPAGHRDSLIGLQQSGYTPAVAAAPDQAGTLDLTTVDFAAYDVVVIASDFGGILRQAELDILNARAGDLRNYINGGGGIVAFAESGSGAGLATHGFFDWMPFLATDVQLNQNEVGYTVTAFGAGLGLVDADVNNNASHNVFTNTGGMNIVNLDGSGRIMSLAARGIRLCSGGFPQVSVGDAQVVEGTGGTTTATVTVSLDQTPCGGGISVDYATGDGTATSGTDYAATAGTLVFPDGGGTTQTITVPIVADGDFEPDELFYVNLVNATNATITSAQGTVTVLNDDSDNNAPSCSAVAPSATELWPPNHTLREVRLAGATDPDGDPVTVTVTGVTQDEAVRGTGDGDTAPDAVAGGASDAVQLRAERAGKGDGRVYRVAFTGDDGNGGTCSGTALVSVRHAAPKPAVDSGASFNSFGV